MMGGKILIIEDNPMVVKSLEFRLKKDAFEVVTAVDGREALKALEAQSFDLVITDLMLPFHSGLEIIEHVRKNFPKLPVIVLSTSKQEETIMEAFNLGVQDFITKPFSPNELSLRVKRSLHKL